MMQIRGLVVLPLPAMIVGLALFAQAGCGDTCLEAADEQGLNAEEGVVYCDLVWIIDQADVSWTVRTNLYDCLPELSAEDRRELAEQLGETEEEERPARLAGISASDRCDRAD